MTLVATLAATRSPVLLQVLPPPHRFIPQHAPPLPPPHPPRALKIANQASFLVLLPLVVVVEEVGFSVDYWNSFALVRLQGYVHQRLPALAKGVGGLCSAAARHQPLFSSSQSPVHTSNR